MFSKLTPEPEGAQQFVQASLGPRIAALGSAVPTRLRSAAAVAGEDCSEPTQVRVPPLVRCRLRVLL